MAVAMILQLTKNRELVQTVWTCLKICCPKCNMLDQSPSESDQVTLVILGYGYKGQNSSR